MRSSSSPATTESDMDIRNVSSLNGNLVNGKDDDEVDLPFQLSPIQMNFFEIYPDGNHLYQLDHHLGLTREINAGEMERALQAVVKKHAMLRARFQCKSPGHWEQKLTTDVTGSLDFQVHENVSDDDFAAITTSAASSINITTGPLMAVRFLSTRSSQLIYLTVHHLVTDLISLRIIFQDLEHLLSSNLIDPQNSVGMPFSRWSTEQARRARKYLEPEKVLPFHVAPAKLKYWGIDNPDTFFRTSYITKRLSLDKTSSAILLDQSVDSLGRNPADVFLSILAKSFHRVFQDRTPPTIFHVSHGRDPWDNAYDLSHTVGWFTATYPIPFNQPFPKDTLELIQQVSSARDSIAHSGTDYFASRYLNSNGAKAFKNHHFAEITVNYAGLYQQFDRKDALFRTVEDTRHGYEGQTAASVRHTSCFEIVIRDVDSRTVFDFTWDPTLKHQDQILLWISETESVVEDLVLSIKGSV